MLKLNANEIFAGSYELIEQLGRGGFAEVWKVKNLDAGIIQALKVYIGLDDTGAEIFRSEYAKLYNLNHPNLLKATYFSVHEGLPFLVMPYCAQGPALKRAGKVDEKELARLIRDIGGALAYLHGLPDPLIHQDIKPDNFLLNDRGDYLLSDFGISSEMRRTLIRSVSDSRKTQDLSSMTPTGQAPPAYRGPELYDKGRVTSGPVIASDIWALGTSLFEMATGELPFSEFGGLSQSLGAALPDLPNTFSPAFQNLVHQCMAVQPWDRPTAAALHNWADDYLRTGLWPAALDFTPATANADAVSSGQATVPAGATPPAATSANATQPVGTKPASGKRTALVALLLLLLGGAGGAAWYFTGNAPDEEALAFEASLKQGEEALLRGDFVAALEFLSTAENYKPQDASLMGFKQTALDSIEQGYQQHFNEGSSKRDRADFDGALMAFNSALVYKPGDEVTLKEIGALEAKVAETKLAAELKQKENQEAYEKAMADGERYQKRKDWASAERAYRKALELKPDDEVAIAEMDKVKDARIEASSSVAAREPSTPSSSTPASSSGKVYSNLSIARKPSSFISLDQVEVTSGATILSITLSAPSEGMTVSLYGPGTKYAFFIRDKDGKEYKLRSAQGINFAENVQITSKKRFKLLFDPIPASVKEFDIYEGKEQLDETTTYWNFRGVKLR